MNLITTLEENIKREQRKNWYLFLSVEKHLVEKYFDWIKLEIDTKNKILKGTGVLIIGNKKYTILLSHSPYYEYRYDRIYINDSTIKYNNEIHMYRDLSLCLYHPIIDKPIFRTIPLHRMIPWISEWIVFYEQWKKYGVWLGKEIKH